MISKHKALQFLEVTGIKEQYSSVIEHTLTYFIARAESEENPIAEHLKKIRDEYHQEFEDVQETAAEVIGEVLNDDELDELIVLHKTPALDKLRGLAPEIMNRILDGFSKKEK